MRIPEDRPFDLEAWNVWVDHPIQIRPMLDLEFVTFQVRLAAFLKRSGLSGSHQLRQSRHDR